MNLDIKIIEKPQKNIDTEIKLKSTTDVINLKDVQAIRNALREHLLFIGLDNKNNVRNISLLGIGSTCDVVIDTKEIIRDFLFSDCKKVILVHNHPSNSTNPSKADLHLTNITKPLLNVFNIELIDHIIVTEKEYISMAKIQKISKDYDFPLIQTMSKGFLLEQNEKLRQENNELKEQLKNKDLDFDMSI